MDNGKPRETRDIAIILDELLTRSPLVTELLNPGLDTSSAQEKLRSAGFRFTPPSEWFQVYAWRNGIGTGDSMEPTLFHYHAFLPIDRAIEQWRICMEANQRGEFDLYRKSLLPIFYFEGEFYGVECSEDPSERGKIYFIFHDETLVFDSLSSMLESIAECYRNGGYTGPEDDIVVNEKIVAQTKAAWNACRRNTDIQDCDHP